ncbi:hypothetical protein O4H29_18590, partial [Marinobacter salarius]|uniref:hypothetical protein n=1 Tax=Marinobacter salarius TaxID=1420917 RepID=UPI0022CA57D5|nr:hypothetical protein [Marinobacter salarius]
WLVAGGLRKAVLHKAVRCLRYRGLANQHQQYDEMYFVFHTFAGNLEKLDIDDPRVAVWDISRVADLVINAGLIDWLLAKRT